MSTATIRPFTISGLDHLTVLVNDMERALQFYQGVLGCMMEARLPQFAMVSLYAGSDHIGLVDVTVPEGQWAKPAISGGSNVDHFALAIRAGDEFVLRSFLDAQSVAIVEERVEENETGRSLSLYVFDPSGNKVELLLCTA